MNDLCLITRAPRRGDLCGKSETFPTPGGEAAEETGVEWVWDMTVADKSTN